MIGRSNISNSVRIPVNSPMHKVGLPFAKRRGGLSATIQAKLLFWGKYSAISDNKMLNLLGDDWLTVAGSAGSETYQCPNNEAYIDVDKDFLWFKTDESQRTVTTNELIGYDFERTLIKYDYASPFSIKEIAILKKDAVLTSNEILDIHKYFMLSIFWSGNFNINGILKGNRAFEKHIWISDAYQLINDGNTLGLYDYLDLNTIEKYDHNNRVFTWKDVLKSGRNLKNVSDSSLPLYETDGILFDGVNNYLTTKFTWGSPCHVYLVFKQITWTNTSCIISGGDGTVPSLYQLGTTPGLKIFPGSSYSDQNDELALNIFGIAKIVFNGSASKLQINDGVVKTANGTRIMSGLSIGGLPIASQFSNIKVKAIIARKVVDSSSNEAIIYNYLKKKYL